VVKPVALEKISREFVAAVLSDWNGDLAFTPDALEQLRQEQFDQIDVLEIVEDGIATNVEKETPDATQIELTGESMSGASLRVVLSYNPHLPGLCVLEVTAL